MINNDRIVPVEATNLIDLYGVILKAASVTVTKATASKPGIFEIASYSNALICNEPVVSVDYDDAITSGTIYFVPAYDFIGFTCEGAAVTESGTVDADGCSLYTATISNSGGTVTYAKVGL